MAEKFVNGATYPFVFPAISTTGTGLTAGTAVIKIKALTGDKAGQWWNGTTWATSGDPIAIEMALDHDNIFTYTSDLGSPGAGYLLVEMEGSTGDAAGAIPREILVEVASTPDAGAPSTPPPDMFVSNASMIAEVETYLQKGGHDVLSENQKQVIRDCNAQAFYHIMGYLRGVGLSQADALKWARGAEFQSALCFYWAMRKLGFYKALEPGQPNPLEKFNRERELAGLFRPGASAALCDTAGNVLFGRTDERGFAVVDLDEG